MTEPKFTPGPWDYDPDGPTSHDVYSAGDFHICAPTGGFNQAGMQKANAHLISAAPDMYGATDPFEAIWPHIEKHDDDVGLWTQHSNGPEDNLRITVGDVRAIIDARRKARGEPTKADGSK